MSLHRCCTAVAAGTLQGENRYIDTLHRVEDEVHPCPTVVFHGSLNELKADTISIRLDGLTLTTGKMTIAIAIDHSHSTRVPLQHLCPVQCIISRPSCKYFNIHSDIFIPTLS
ncbi:hypothetical protein AALO_G00017160 [Alosa alosa]|uniref:Uncharacterized protein n=1 Tax=Alosa alosa TaxID=278164 RepID=A0AAV6HHA1_9TELE|nr:hypothetical protein AALO_G00017160 [Alosa alosa]